jgi:hypothetical protein
MNGRIAFVCIRNDNDVLHLCFARYGNLLLELARCLVREDVDAQNAVRHCRREALTGRREFSLERAFRSWLFRILSEEGVLIVSGGYPEEPGRAEPVLVGQKDTGL